MLVCFDIFFVSLFLLCYALLLLCSAVPLLLSVRVFVDTQLRTYIVTNTVESISSTVIVWRLLSV